MKTTNVQRHGASTDAVSQRPGDPDQTQGIAKHVHAHAYTAAFAALALTACGVGFAAAEDGITLAALKIAYGRECNSQLHYGAFASRAERDGMPAAALAFRAAAVAEGVHAALQSAQIEQLGAVPTWTIESVVIRSTEENLRQAITNETREYQSVYGQLVDQSRSECLYDALASLNYARGAEATHASLFVEVLQKLEPLETPPMLAAAVATFPNLAGEVGTAFYVCTGDGSVFTHPMHGSCPNCGSGKNSFHRMTTGDHPRTQDADRLSMSVVR